MTTLRYTSALLCLGLATTAMAQGNATAANPEPSTLTDEDRQMLRVVYAYVKSECARDPSAAFCSSLGPDKAAATVPAVAAASVPPPAHKSPEEIAERNTPSDANRHLGGDAGLTIPQKNSAEVSFATATDTKTASASLSLNLSPVTHGFHTLAVTVQTPLGQGSDYQNLATLDGLTKATTAGLQYTYIPPARYVQHTQVYESDEYRSACKEVFDQAVAIDPKIAEDRVVKLTWPRCNGGLLEQAISASKVITAIQKTLLTDKLHELESTVTPVLQSLWMFALNAKVGHEQHSYFSSSTLEKATVDRYPWQVGAAATYVFDKGLMSLTLGYNFQKSFQDGRLKGQPEVLCPPASATIVKCVNGYIDGPQLQQKHLFSADWRFIAPKGSFFIPIGIDPGVTYDAKSDEFGLQFPVYLATNSSKGLTGGFRYDYTSKKKVSTFGVFVSAALCVLPGFSGCAPSK